MDWVMMATATSISGSSSTISNMWSIIYQYVPTLFICSMDTIAPIFFLFGLISAIVSHFGYEFIGGMASRGKTRPPVPPVSSSSSSASVASSSTRTDCNTSGNSSNTSITKTSTVIPSTPTASVSSVVVPSSISPRRLVSSSSGTSSTTTSPTTSNITSSSSSFSNGDQSESKNSYNDINHRTSRWIKSFLYGNQWSVQKSFFLHYYLAGTISLLFVMMYWCYNNCPSKIIMPLSNASESITTTTSVFSMTEAAFMMIRTKTNMFTPATMALYVLCFIHCVRRSYECYCIHLFSPTSKMHVLFYIIAILYYVLIPAILFDLPIPCHVAETVGGDSNISSRACYRLEYYNYVASIGSNNETLSSPSSSSVLSIASIVAVTCFGLWAQYQQYRHHCILANLRRRPPRSSTTTSALLVSSNNIPSLSNGCESNTTPSSSPSHALPNSADGANVSRTNTTSVNSSNVSVDINSYKIPMDGWFEYVTCPHYFAEVLLYLSYGILIGVDGRLPNLSRCIYFYYFLLAHPNNTASTSLLSESSSSSYTISLYFIFTILWEFRYIITFLFVVLNLQFAAIDNHNWYCMKFNNYSKLHRKTMFPFLY
jgi:hypothetical protein